MNVQVDLLSQGVFAVELALPQGLDPVETLRDQFLINDGQPMDIPGFSCLPLQGWAVHYGASVRILSMEDAQGRRFGAFIGIGVDPDGRLIDAACFARLDCTAPGFDAEITALLNYTAGRWMAVVVEGHLNAQFTELADPRLANQPHHGAVRDLVKSGAFVPAEPA